jgi:hypothetical protein
LQSLRFRRLLLLLGLAFLFIVALTHIAEDFHIFPAMGWGLPDSVGHYLDLVSAILGCALLLISLVLIVAARKSRHS